MTVLPHDKPLDLSGLATKLVQRLVLGAEQVEYIGGDPTVAQRLLIERIIKMNLQLDALEAKLERDEWTTNDQRTYGALNNALRLALRELEAMGQRARGKKKKGPDLDELITEHRRPA